MPLASVNNQVIWNDYVTLHEWISYSIFNIYKFGLVFQCTYFIVLAILVKTINSFDIPEVAVNMQRWLFLVCMWFRRKHAPR